MSTCRASIWLLRQLEYIVNAKAMKERQFNMVQTYHQHVSFLLAPLKDIQQAAGYVRQNMNQVSWLIIGLMLSAGLVIGLMLGYWHLRSSQNNIQEQLNRIEQYLAARQPPAPASAVSECMLRLTRVERRK